MDIEWIFDGARQFTTTHYLWVALGLVLLIQLIYYLFFFISLVFHKHKKDEEYVPSPLSIIVAVHNDLEALKKLVPALLSQNHPDFEIIIVNDRSEQDVFAYLYELKHQCPGIRVINIFDCPEGFSPKKYALFLGIKSAKTEDLLFTDADCIPEPDWARRMQSYLVDNKEIVLGFSPYQKLSSLLNTIIQYETLMTAMLYLGLAKQGMPWMGVGRNLAYKKSLFLRSKGFVEHKDILGGDDDLLINSVATEENTAVCIQPQCTVVTYPKTTLSAWFLQKKRHWSTSRYYKFKNKLKPGLFITSMIFFYIFLIVLYLSGENPLFILSLYGFRLLVVLVTSGMVVRKLKDKTHWFLLPLLEIMYIFYNVVVSSAAMVSGKVKWR